MKIALILLLILAFGTGFMLWRAARNEAETARLYPPDGKIVKANGHDVHVKIMGNGPPIVLLHGASGNLRDMTWRIAPALAENFTVIAMDRPGFGYTPPLGRDGATLAQQAEVLRAALNALGYRKAYVMGQSYGGSVALRWALDYPDSVAGLLLVSAPSNVWPTGLGTLYRINANPITGPLLRLWVAAFPPRGLVRASLASVYEPQPVPAGYGDHLGIGLVLMRSTQRENALQVAALKEQVRAMVPRYGEIDLPVEAVHGTADTVVPSHIHTEKLAQQIRGINVTFLQGVGHMPHNTNTDKVVAAALRLLKRGSLK